MTLLFVIWIQITYWTVSTICKHMFQLRVYNKLDKRTGLTLEMTILLQQPTQQQKFKLLKKLAGWKKPTQPWNVSITNNNYNMRQRHVSLTHVKLNSSNNKKNNSSINNNNSTNNKSKIADSEHSEKPNSEKPEKNLGTFEVLEFIFRVSKKKILPGNSYYI